MKVRAGMLGGLAGKRVVVTGGTSGIGEAVCRRFIEEGCRVVATGLTRRECEEVRGRLPGLVGALAVDVAQPDEVARAFQEVDRLFEDEGLDVLINNAGMSVRHSFLDITPEEWQRVLAVNLSGMFYCAQQAARRMMAGAGGCILMTASTNGMVGHPFYADYNASKAGVILLTRTMALELAPQVRAPTASAPGMY